jgi:hypothetical protein
MQVDLIDYFYLSQLPHVAGEGRRAGSCDQTERDSRLPVGNEARADPGRQSHIAGGLVDRSSRIGPSQCLPPDLRFRYRRARVRACAP